MLAAAVQVLVLGLYNSAVFVTAPVSPPATRTWPLFSSVAVASRRPVDRLPAAVQLLLLGLYSSALLRLPLLLNPPATRTWPLPSSVAVASDRAVTSVPADDQVPEL